MKKLISIIGPFCFSFYIVLSLYAHNIFESSFNSIFIPLLITFIITGIFYLIFLVALKDLNKAYITTTLMVIFVFLYGPFNGFFGEIFARENAELYNFIYTFWFLLFSFLIALVVLKKKVPENLVKVFFLTIVFLNVYVFLGLAFGVNKLPHGPVNESPASEDINKPEIENSKEKYPDIYFILTDRYLSNYNLEKDYVFNNEEFTSFLRNKGFFVQDRQYSNYLKTLHSLSSTLNMNYINYLSEGGGQDSKSLIPLFNILNDNAVVKSLKQRGYKYIHMGSWWEGTRKNRLADYNFSPYSLPELVEMLYKNSVLYPLSNFMDILNFRQRQYKKTLYQMEVLKNIPEVNDPTFVFAHFLITHPPYVFDENGDIMTRFSRNEKEEAQDYITQVKNANRMLENLVEGILAKSDIPPVIIIQSDEGKYPYNINQNDDFFNWFSASPEDVDEKLSIFSAIYIPDFHPEGQNFGVSPVNTFRLVFNKIFNEDLELLPDKYYLFQSYRKPYVFKEWSPQSD